VQSSHPPHVGLFFELTSSYNRGLIRGVSRFAQHNGPWRLHLLEILRPADIRRWLDARHCDGIIARVKTQTIAAAIAGCGVPVVNVSGSARIAGWPWFGTDDAAVCWLAVDHLVAHGYTTLAFCGMPKYEWSVRLAGLFAAEAVRHDVTCRRIDLPSLTLDNAPTRADRLRLTRWIAALPKPVGIMATCDYCGRFVLEACTDAGVVVPDEAGVIGIDNNEEFCGLCSPPMSSIEPNAALTGHLAAEELARLLAGEAPRSLRTFVKPIGVVGRRSTDADATGDPVVAEAVRFIRGYGVGSIGVPDVARHVNVSRRHLELEFRRMLGRSVLAEIQRVRLERAQRLLGETDWKMETVAARAGFRRAASMTALFVKKLGIRPGEYRRNIQAMGERAGGTA
jgi:LacI family transcriptional regulator